MLIEYCVQIYNYVLFTVGAVKRRSRLRQRSGAMSTARWIAMWQSGVNGMPHSATVARLVSDS